MDPKGELREFLTSRRARITPEQAGLTVYGDNRRVPGLRREEVAMLAGVSADYYTQVERGNISGVSDGVLEALVRALRLDDASGRICSTSSAPGEPRPRPAGVPRSSMCAQACSRSSTR